MKILTIGSTISYLNVMVPGVSFPLVVQRIRKYQRISAIMCLCFQLEEIWYLYDFDLEIVARRSSPMRHFIRASIDDGNYCDHRSIHIYVLQSFLILQHLRALGFPILVSYQRFRMKKCFIQWISTRDSSVLYLNDYN